MNPMLLVVDDETMTRRLVTHILRPLGIDVVGVGDGEAALGIAASATPAVILVDLNLPGMDGFSLIAALRALPHLAAVPIYAFTARNHPDDEAQARALGASGFLYKPFSTGELRALVGRELGLPS
jgi:two-component system chemotaxis response regulator CheY